MRFERTVNSIRYMVTGAVNRIVSLFLPFILRTLFIKYLGEEYLGINSLFSSILNVLNLAELGFGSAVAVSMYKPIAQDDKATICALMSLYKKVYRIIGSIVIVAGLAVIPFLEYFISGECPAELNLYILYLLYLISTASGYFLFAYKQVLLSAHQRSDVIETVGMLVKLLTCFLQGLAIVLWKNIYLYVILNMVNGIASNLICAWISHRYYPEYNCAGKVKKSLLHSIYKKVGGLLIQKFGQMLTGQLDTIVISSFLGLVLVARYTNYSYVANSVGSFVQLFFGSMTAGLGNCMITNSVSWNYKNLKKIQFIGAWIVGWCSICLFCLYQPFMVLWVGKDKTLPFSTVIYMTAYFYIFYNKRLIVTFKDAAGMWWEDKWKPLVAGLFNLLVNIILVQYIGVNGVIISTILSYMLVEIPWETKVLFRNYFKMSTFDYYRTHLKFLFVSLISGTATFGCCWVIQMEGIWGWLIKAGVCAVIPNCIYFIVYRKQEEFHEIINMLVMLKKRLIYKK